MLALRGFLINQGRERARGFTTNDFTASNWSKINEVGASWTNDASPVHSWESLVPSLDLWLQVEPTEIHYVRGLLPTLAWRGGLIGVRLRFQPKEVMDLRASYLVALSAADRVRSAATPPDTVKVWPQDLKAFLDRKLRDHFAITYYALDPAKCKDPVNGIAEPQFLTDDAQSFDGNPLDGLIRIDEVAAQRGFADSHTNNSDLEESRDGRKLTEQLRTYYARHLDISDVPDAADLDALLAIENAQDVFDERLREGFAGAMQELSTLSYPGITDARLKLATKIRPGDGLNHNAAVQYELFSDDALQKDMTLPEDYNGLGYQNLISMVFRLMSFRDDWLRVGKAGSAASSRTSLPPIHLVLIEEPEAHLHVQVQQVFLRKAYDVLRNHDDLRVDSRLVTQLVVSTHSSHIAHDVSFASIRYFRRLRRRAAGEVPVSGVINLSGVFGSVDETSEFVARYLRAVHCDLFFADAAILVEGQAERILLPYFIQKNYPKLFYSYISILEIGGSHAHRFSRLIEHLGLTTLVVTDIDPCSRDGSKYKAAVPCRQASQVTSNATLKKWHPREESFDTLCDLPDQSKIKPSSNNSWKLRVAYQIPTRIEFPAGAFYEALCATFEDALIYENLEFFRTVDGAGLLGAAKKAITSSADGKELAERLFKAVRKRDKGEFALELLFLDTASRGLKPPTYISEGLAWLQAEIQREAIDVGTLPMVPAEGVDRAAPPISGLSPSGRSNGGGAAA